MMPKMQVDKGEPLALLGFCCLGGDFWVIFYCGIHHREKIPVGKGGMTIPYINLDLFLFGDFLWILLWGFIAIFKPPFGSDYVRNFFL